MHTLRLFLLFATTLFAIQTTFNYHFYFNTMARGLGPKATDANLTPLGPRRRFGTKPDAPKAIEPALAAHAEPGEPIEKPVEKPDVAIQAQVNGRELPPKIAAPSLGYPECIGEGSLTVEAPHCKPVDKPVNKPVPSSNGQAKGPGVPPKTATTKLNHLERAGEGTSTPKVKSVNQPAPKRSADEACLENYTTPAKKAKTDSNVSEHDDEGAPSVQLHHDKLVGQPAPTHADSSTVEAMPKGSRSKFTPTDHGRDSTPTDKVPHDKQANRTAPVTTTPSTSADTTKAPISPPKTAAVTPNPTERRSRSALKVKASHDDVVDQLAPASPATASSETTVKAPDSQPKRAATGSETAESVASPVQAATEARDEAIARRSPPAIARASQRNQPSLSNLGLHPDRLKMIEGSSLMAPPPTEARRKRKSPYDFPPDEASPRTRDSASRRPNPSPSNLGLHPDRLKMLEECSLGPKPVITPGNGRTKRATSPPPAQVHRKRDLPSDFPSDGPSPPKRHKSGPTGSDANLVPLGPSKLKR